MHFLRGQAEEIGLECRVVEPLVGRPVVVMSWPGSEPTLPTLLLNSHIDVVPVFEVRTVEDSSGEGTGGEWRCGAQLCSPWDWKKVSFGGVFSCV